MGLLLEKTKTGDTLLVFCRRPCAAIESDKCVVSRALRSQIVLNYQGRDIRFRRSDGRQVGVTTRRGKGWEHYFATTCDPEILGDRFARVVRKSREELGAWKTGGTGRVKDWGVKFGFELNPETLSCETPSIRMYISPLSNYVNVHVANSLAYAEWGGYLHEKWMVNLRLGGPHPQGLKPAAQHLLSIIAGIGADWMNPLEELCTARVERPLDLSCHERLEMILDVRSCEVSQ